jgi:hypothetical protein
MQYESMTFEDFAFWGTIKPSFTSFMIIVLFLILISNITNNLIFQPKLYIHYHILGVDIIT